MVDDRDKFKEIYDSKKELHTRFGVFDRDRISLLKKDIGVIWTKEFKKQIQGDHAIFFKEDGLFDKVGKLILRNQELLDLLNKPDHRAELALTEEYPLLLQGIAAEQNFFREFKAILKDITDFYHGRGEAKRDLEAWQRAFTDFESKLNLIEANLELMEHMAGIIEEIEELEIIFEDFFPHRNHTKTYREVKEGLEKLMERGNLFERHHPIIIKHLLGLILDQQNHLKDTAQLAEEIKFTGTTEESFDRMGYAELTLLLDMLVDLLYKILHKVNKMNEFRQIITLFSDEACEKLNSGLDNYLVIATAILQVLRQKVIGRVIEEKQDMVNALNSGLYSGLPERAFLTKAFDAFMHGRFQEAIKDHFRTLIVKDDFEDLPGNELKLYAIKKLGELRDEKAKDALMYVRNEAPVDDALVQAAETALRKIGLDIEEPHKLVIIEKTLSNVTVKPGEKRELVFKIRNLTNTARSFTLDSAIKREVKENPLRNWDLKVYDYLASGKLEFRNPDQPIRIGSRETRHINVTMHVPRHTMPGNFIFFLHAYPTEEGAPPAGEGKLAVHRELAKRAYDFLQVRINVERGEGLPKKPAIPAVTTLPFASSTGDFIGYALERDKKRRNIVGFTKSRLSSALKKLEKANEEIGKDDELKEESERITLQMFSEGEMVKVTTDLGYAYSEEVGKLLRSSSYYERNVNFKETYLELRWRINELLKMWNCYKKTVDEVAKSIKKIDRRRQEIFHTNFTRKYPPDERWKGFKISDDGHLILGVRSLSIWPQIELHLRRKRLNFSYINSWFEEWNECATGVAIINLFVHKIKEHIRQTRQEGT